MKSLQLKFICPPVSTLAYAKSQIERINLFQPSLLDVYYRRKTCQNDKVNHLLVQLSSQCGQCIRYHPQRVSCDCLGGIARKIVPRRRVADNLYRPHSRNRFRNLSDAARALARLYSWFFVLHFDVCQQAGVKHQAVDAFSMLQHYQQGERGPGSRSICIQSRSVTDDGRKNLLRLLLDGMKRSDWIDYGKLYKDVMEGENTTAIASQSTKR